jgi:hypothetical protein
MVPEEISQTLLTNKIRSKEKFTKYTPLALQRQLSFALTERNTFI